MKKSALFVSLAVFAVCGLWARSVNVVSDFKAKGDGKTVCTNEIQAAIDECAKTGGGEVFVPAGVYKTATLMLRDNVTLYLDRDAIISGVAGKENYKQALVFGDKVKDVAIKGMGEINGNGALFNEGDNAGGRPIGILFKDSKNIRVEGITLKNPAFWSFKMQRCDSIIVNRMKIYAHSNWNNDGFDIDSKNVVISDCIINTDDDAICFKSESRNFIVENVAITNCVVSSNCNFIKFGTASAGGFKNIAISNCVLKKAAEDNIRKWKTSKWISGRYGRVGDYPLGLAGIALEAVDGGYMEQVAISNLVMSNVFVPIFIRVGHRNKDAQKSYIKDVIISDIVANSETVVTSSITSIPDHGLSNIVLRNCIFNVFGSGTEKMATTPVPEVENKYPECLMFNFALPSFGLYLRHANNITLDNVQIRVKDVPDYRHAVVADDVSMLRVINCIFEKPAGKLKTFNAATCKDPYFFNNLEVEQTAVLKEKAEVAQAQAAKGQAKDAKN